MRLSDINDELALLHKKMLERDDYRRRTPINEQLDDEKELINCYEEGTVLSMLQQLYGYVEHGTNIGQCWVHLNEEIPKFII